MPTKTTLPALVVEETQRLPDNKLYTNRFEIKSESSDCIYIVAQSKKNRGWSCSCVGWIRWRRCKHLNALGLPAKQQPFEVTMESHTDTNVNETKEKV